jgi:hypothetical protein
MIRHLGSNQHWYAIQCTLPINIYNDKIFLGIWIWLIVLTILNVLSIINWLISLTEGRRLATIGKYLTISTAIPVEKESLLSSPTTSRVERTGRRIDYLEFTEYLHMDGFLVFKIIANNTDELVAGQIIEHLYRNYEPPSRSTISNV